MIPLSITFNHAPQSPKLQKYFLNLKRRWKRLPHRLQRLPVVERQRA